MSRVYTNKPAVARKTGGNKPAQSQKNPGTTTKPKQTPLSTLRTVQARPNQRRLPNLVQGRSSNPNTRMSGPGYSGGAYGHGGTGEYGSRSSYGQSQRQREHQDRQDQSLNRNEYGGNPSVFQQNQEFQNEESSPPGAERRLEYKGGFSMIPPDEKRRRQVEAQARKETEQYERFKEQKKPGRVSYVGTAGGGLTEGQARAQAAKTQSQAKYTSLQKCQQYKDEKKRREDMEYEDKKARARQQSAQNARREDERQRSLKQDMRVQNNAFLDRLERK